MGVDSFALPADMTLGRLRGRIDLRSALAERQRTGRVDFDSHYGKAFSLIESTRTERAFRLDTEAPATRDRYGQTRFGQSCLLARRLIEADTRFVQVNCASGSDTEH